MASLWYPPTLSPTLIDTSAACVYCYLLFCDARRKGPENPQCGSVVLRMYIHQIWHSGSWTVHNMCPCCYVHNYVSRFKVQVRGCNILLLSWAWCLSDHLQVNSIHSVLTDKHSGAGPLEGFECCETGDCPVPDPRIVPIIPTAAEGEPGARVSDTVQTTLGV